MTEFKLSNDLGDFWITDIFNIENIKSWNVNWQKVLKYTDSVESDNSLMVNTNLHNVYGNDYNPFKFTISGILYRDINTSGAFSDMTQLIAAIKFIEQKIFLRRTFLTITVNGALIKNCVPIENTYSNIKYAGLHKGSTCYTGYICNFSFTFAQVNTAGDTAY